MKSTGLVFDGEVSVGPEPSATTYYDRSRFGNNGTLSVAVGANGEAIPDWVQETSGLWVLHYDGLGGYVNIGQDHSLDFTYALTIEAWVKPEGAHYQASGAIFHDYYDDNDNIIRVNDNGSLAGRFQIPALAYRTISSPVGSVVLNVYSYIVFIYDGSEAVFWINAVKQTPVVGVSGKIVLSTNDRKIGAGRVGGSWNFNGKISLFRMRSYALSAGKINQRYEAERHFFGV